MTMFDSRLFLVLLAVLAPSLGSAPGSDELHDKLLGLINQLQAAKDDFQSIFDIIDEQCPCQNPGERDCFETSVLDLYSSLCDLISDLSELTNEQTDDCPPLKGCAVLVAGCNSSDIAVVDPVGTILPSIKTNDSVSALTVFGPFGANYFLFYTTSNPLIVVQVNQPSGDVIPITRPLDGEATGIANFVGTLIIAMEDFNGNNVIYTSEVIVNISCPGRVRIWNDLVYFSDCNEIQTVRLRGEDLETIVKFPMNIASFDVIDSETIVFCDEAGGLWTYSNDTECFKLLDCNVDQPCSDVKINQCSSLVYVAYPYDANLDIFNPTTCEKKGTLTYTTSTPKECPSLDFEPSMNTLNRTMNLDRKEARFLELVVL